MRKIATRSAFTAALCAGVAMVGASVHGLLRVDAELQRSTLAAKRHQVDTIRVTWHPRGSDCTAPPPLRERI